MLEATGLAPHAARLAVLVLSWLAPILTWWIFTGPITDPRSGPSVATRLNQGPLAELERSLQAAGRNALVLSVNDPAYPLSGDACDRFTSAAPRLLLPPLGDAVLPMDGATRWLRWRHPMFRGEVCALVVSISTADIERFPVVVSRSPDRIVVELHAEPVQHNLSRTGDHPATAVAGDLVVIEKRWPGRDAPRARLFAFDGVQGTLKPFPEVLEIRLDPSVHGPFHAPPRGGRSNHRPEDWTIHRDVATCE